MTDKNEIVVYRPSENVQLQVRLAEESVWLNQSQLVELFDSSKANINEHIKNIYAQHELDEVSTIRKFRTVQIEGNRQVARTIAYYNLDAIISIGFRVNTQRGIQFRQWANNVLKDYLLRGYAFNQRFERIEHRLANVEERQEAFDIEIHAALPPTQGVFFEGQVFSARKFVEDLVREAKSEIVVIDTYVDSTVLDILNERASGVKATIYTDTISKVLMQDEELNFKQTGKRVELKQYKTNFHDRFLIIDDDLYHFGASFKDLGKRLFAFEKMGIDKKIILSQL